MACTVLSRSAVHEVTQVRPTTGVCKLSLAVVQNPGQLISLGRFIFGDTGRIVILTRQAFQVNSTNCNSDTSIEFH